MITRLSYFLDHYYFLWCLIVYLFTVLYGIVSYHMYQITESVYLSLNCITSDHMQSFHSFIMHFTGTLMLHGTNIHTYIYDFYMYSYIHVIYTYIFTLEVA